MSHRRTERRSWIATASASCLATVVILGGAAAGTSSATAGDPDEVVGEAPAVVTRGFVPALPAGPPQPAAQTISGVEVGAQLRGTGPEASVEVALHNPSGARRTVSCEVVLERVTFGEAAPMARMMPPPQISTVHTVPINASLEGGERRTTVARLPASVLGPEASSGTLRIAIRERS